MKSDSAPKKQTLKLKVDKELRFRLVGISCHENDYRLVWAINNQLKMNFVRIANLVVHHQKLKTDLEFSRFTYHDEDRYITYHLISNRCPDGFLFPEFKNLDFLVQVNGEIRTSDMEMVIKQFRKIEIISAVFPIDPKAVKHIDRISFE